MFQPSFILWFHRLGKMLDKTKPMKWVEVWLENTETIGFVLGSKSGDGRLILVPAEQKLMGRCEATKRAVAQLAGVSEEIAAQALAQPGEPVFIRKKAVSSLHVSLYLVVYPTQKPRKPK